VLTRRRLFPVLLTCPLAVIVAAFAPATLAVDDTTPPEGSLTIEGGLGYTNDEFVVLDVPATDDVGVTVVRAGLYGGPLTEYPYTPQIVHSIGDISTMAQQQLTIQVEWLDAAGNSSTQQGTVWLDWAAPDLQNFQTTNSEGPPGTVTFYLGAYEEASGVAAARFSTSGGSSWGAEIAMGNQIVVWNPRDPSVGGDPTAIGEHTVHAQVRDGSGQWSNIRSLAIVVAVPLAIGVSANPTTGQPLTLSAGWAGPIALPAGAMCMWEFMWGDDQSMYFANRNETFGYLVTQGPASSGFCDSWTFTLPWTPVRQYFVALRVMTSDWVDLGSAMIGASPDDPSFSSAVGSTSRSITASNLPMFYVLPDAYELTLGEPAVYRGFALGGATIKSSDVWSIQYENTPERHPGSAVLTFYPKTTGHLTICLYREYRAGTQMGACFDPPVRAASGGDSGPTSPPPAAPTSTVSTSPTGEPVVTDAPTPRPTIPPLAAATGLPTPTSSDAASLPTAPSSRAPVEAILIVIIALGAATGVAWRRGSLTELVARVSRLRRP
jgi:hypothetical protein